MQNIEINEKITREWVATLISEGYDTYRIISNYKIEEDSLLDSFDLLDKNVLIDGLNFSEDFITKATDLGLFLKEDISNLSMTTYSNLTPEFISKWGEQINWNRMILFISTQSNSFDNYIEIIESNNLWGIISANDLPTEFIRTWKDKLNWELLSMVKEFTEEEKDEFQNYIIPPSFHEDPDEFQMRQNFPDFSEIDSDKLNDLIQGIYGKN